MLVRTLLKFMTTTAAILLCRMNVFLFMTGQYYYEIVQTVSFMAHQYYEIVQTISFYDSPQANLL